MRDAQSSAAVPYNNGVLYSLPSSSCPFTSWWLAPPSLSSPSITYSIMSILISSLVPRTVCTFHRHGELVSYFDHLGKVPPISVATGLFKSYRRKSFLSVFPTCSTFEAFLTASLGDPSRRVILVGDIHGQYDHLQCVTSFIS